jgi:hypothetical protein
MEADGILRIPMERARALALVGNQPTALAMAVRSLESAYPGSLCELQMLSTPQVAGPSERLRRYFERELPNLALPEPIVVAPRFPVLAVA